ncbi:MAG TPA: pitrilysin family protein [Vicinamibacterales bacterium]
MTRVKAGRIPVCILAVAAMFAAGIGLRAQAPDRSKPPVSGPPPELRLPPIEKRQLSNGVAVWIVELHEVPVAQVNLLVRSGGADDPPRRFGVANMTAAMLEEGAGSRTALQIADEIDYLGADLSAGSGMDSSVVRLHVPVARLGEALPIMADIALRPTFPSEELDRVRQERLTSILQARDDPPAIASAAFARVLFGVNHRYGTPAAGTAEVIKTFAPGDLKDYYAHAYRPDNATLIVVGDTTPDRVLPQLESAFGSWKAPAGAITHAAMPPGQQPSGRTIYLIDKPGAPQSQIRIGGVGVARSTPDFFPIQIVNTILGGSFTSRLNNNLREVHGYAYGAGSSFDMRMGGGLFSASAGVQTDKTAEALTEFFNELNGILKPVPADELTRARNYVALRFPGAFETTGDMSRRLEDMLLFRLPEDYFSKYVQNIQAVSAADAQRVAQKYILPGQAAVVVVGDRKAIEPAIRALNLGTIKIMTIDEVFGPKP